MAENIISSKGTTKNHRTKEEHKLYQKANRIRLRTNKSISIIYIYIFTNLEFKITNGFKDSFTDVEVIEWFNNARERDIQKRDNI